MPAHEKMPGNPWTQPGFRSWLNTPSGCADQPAPGYKPVYMSPEGIIMWRFDDETWQDDNGIAPTNEDVTVRGFDESTWLARLQIVKPEFDDPE